MYPALNSTLVGTNLAELFVYANSVTHDMFALFMVAGFFIVVAIGSMLLQLRFTAQVKPEQSILASSFATLGWATILEQYSGILNPTYFIVLFVIFILSLIWNFMSAE